MGADDGKHGPGDVEEPVEEGLAELLPPALGVEEVEEHDAGDREGDDVEDELSDRVASHVVPLALGLLLLLLLVILVLRHLRHRLLLALLLLGDGLLHEHLLVGAEVGRAEAVDLVLDRALLGREELEVHLLEARVLRELLVADEPVGLLVDEQHHPLLVTVIREERRVHGHGRTQRLGGEAELARLRVALLLPLPLRALPIEVGVAPRVHQALLLLLVLVRALLILLELLVEDGVVGLGLIVGGVVPVRVVGEVLALDGDDEVDHVALLHVLLVLGVGVESDVNVGEVHQEEVDVEVLLLAQRRQQLSPLLHPKLLDLVNGAAGTLRRREALVDHLDALLVKVWQLQQVVGVEPHRLHEELRALDHVHGRGHEALLHANVEQAVEQVVNSFEHIHRILLQRAGHRLAQQVSVHNRLHLHDVVVDVALVLDKLVGDLAMQLAEVVRLRVFARDALPKLAR
mmetsp:Transcript_13892/g.36469  ORF Transcript_13892/g.36469 Transcript_13892/m.36469 type:complete len:460 (-) Transcript_13892:422-1801(-)